MAIFIDNGTVTLKDLYELEHLALVQSLKTKNTTDATEKEKTDADRLWCRISNTIAELEENGELKLELSQMIRQE